MEDIAREPHLHAEHAHQGSSKRRPRTAEEQLFDAVERQWHEYGLCLETDPEAFYPDKGGSTREAKMVCQACPVKDECLEYALLNDERYGIWGGLSDRERRRLRKKLG